MTDWTKARYAAVRFLEAITALEDEQKRFGDHAFTGRFNSAVRRASLDLTRALADARNPRRVEQKQQRIKEYNEYTRRLLDKK